MAQRFVTRGFVGRRTTGHDSDLVSRVPPGQYLTADFPVLSAGPTPRTPLDRWSFTIEGLVGEPMRWSWDEFLALPSRDWTVDISCVTKWTKLDMRWRGVSADTLFEHVDIDPAAPVTACRSRFRRRAAPRTRVSRTDRPCRSSQACAPSPSV